MKTKAQSILRFIPLLAVVALAPSTANAADMYVYFGTHRSGPGIGFSLAHFDTDTGALTKPEFIMEAVEPAFFVIHPDGKHLYTCNSGQLGSVSAYEIDPKTGRLTLLNQKPAGGADPSYIVLDKTSRYALVANYQGGNIAVLAIKADSSLGERTAFAQHTGSSVNPQRQTRPFAHSIIVDPSNRFVLVADLGVDKVFVYRFNEKDGTLTPNDPPFAAVKPGSGPRHVKFHPNGKWVYLINEIGSTVIGFNWDGTKGTLTEFQTVSTLPEGFTNTSTCAELEIHPNGKFLYGSNRGHDSIIVFAVDQATGKLTLVEHVSSQGKTPRNFAFDPTGRWIICSNHGSNNAVVFRVNETTGKLTQTGQPVEVPYPFCERFLPVP
ncbi:MAG: lactonase family protein [Verrucomicrobiia bacterium]